MARLGLALVLLVPSIACAHVVGDAAKAAAQDATPTAIDQGLKAVQTPEDRKLLGEFFAMPEVREATRHVGADIMSGVVSSVSSRLGDVHVDVTTLSREVSKGAVLGMDDALRELEAKEKNGTQTGLLGRLTRASAKGVEITTVALIVLGVLLAALAIWVVRLVRQTRREQAEVARQASAMALMAEAIRATETKAWAPELRAVLEQQLQDSEAGRYLKTMLNDRHDRPATTH
jgi:hypothetical protein